MYPRIQKCPMCKQEYQIDKVVYLEKDQIYKILFNRIDNLEKNNKNY